jgi:hypothetical protein
MSERFKLNLAEIGYACSPLVNVGEGMHYTHKQVMALREEMSGDRRVSLDGWLRSQRELGGITDDNLDYLVFALRSYRNIDGDQHYLLESGVDMREQKGAMEVLMSSMDAITYIDELRGKAEQQALAMGHKRMEAFASGVPAALDVMQVSYSPSEARYINDEMGYAAMNMFDEAVRVELGLDPQSEAFWAIFDQTDLKEGTGADYLMAGYTVAGMLDELRAVMKQGQEQEVSNKQSSSLGMKPSQPRPQQSTPRQSSGEGMKI